MVIKDVQLETVCGITSRIPDNRLAEVAFAGKSNVGKSSLINTLMNRKALARTSAKPGKTQTINFYNINGRMYLVDLPGYGYASANVEIKAKWGQMIENYLHVSRQLAAVFLLIDIRHEPSENDRMMYQWILHQGYDPIIIATKLDKISRSQVSNHMRAIEKGLHVKQGTVIIPFSAHTKQGREEIWALIDQLAAVEDAAAPDSSGNFLPEDTAGQAGSAQPKSVSGQGVAEAPDSADAGVSRRAGSAKPRWKAVGKPTAKKTLKRRKKKKAK